MLIFQNWRIQRSRPHFGDFTVLLRNVRVGSDPGPQTRSTAFGDPSVLRGEHLHANLRTIAVSVFT